MGYRLVPGANADLFGIGSMSATQAVKTLKEHAAQGNPDAMRMLGLILLKGTDVQGRAVKRDPGQGLKLLKDAAECGDEIALMTLGAIYLNGLPPVEKDPGKARAIFAKAAEFDCAEGKFFYAQCLLDEDEANRDDKKIFELMKSAAAYGMTEARQCLANFYLEGRGVRRSIKKAISLLEELANEDDPRACYRLSEIYADSNTSYYNENKSNAMLEKASRGGLELASKILAAHYETGVGTDFDPARTLSLYRSLRDRNPHDSGVLYKIAEVLLFKNFALKESYKDEGADCLKKAAAAGCPPALLALGRCHIAGEHGFPKDEAVARKLILKAAGTGDPRSLSEIGRMYRAGFLFKEDTAEALKYLSRAADADCSQALYELGCMYWNGEGVTANKTEALNFFKAAANLKSPLGAFEYGRELIKSKAPKSAEKGLWFLKYAAAAGVIDALKWLRDYYFEHDPDPDDSETHRAGWYLRAAIVVETAIWLISNWSYVTADAMIPPECAFKFLSYAADNYESYDPDALGPSVFGALGLCYEAGIGCKPNIGTALKLYEKGVGLNDPGAMLNLAYLYRGGKGVKQDLKKADELERRARELAERE